MSFSLMIELLSQIASKLFLILIFISPFILFSLLHICSYKVATIVYLYAPCNKLLI